MQTPSANAISQSQRYKKNQSGRQPNGNVNGKHLNVRLLHTNIFFTKKDSKTLAHIKKKM